LRALRLRPVRPTGWKRLCGELLQIKLVPLIDYLEKKLQFLPKYKEETAETFSKLAKIRNTLAHRYLVIYDGMI